MLRREVLVAVALIACVPAQAQEYPTRPLRMVVGYAHGGTTDFTARVVAPKLSEALKQTVIVDNRPGAGGNIGADLVAKSAPDGYTIMMADTTFGIVPALYSRLPFNVQRDFSPVMHVISVPNCLVVHPSVPAKSVKELVALARTKPGQLTYGSGGVGTPLHMGGEQLKLAAKIDLVHVPYKGAAPAMVDLVSGQISMIFPTMTLGLPHIKAGKLRALAVTSAKRSPALADVPTTAEAGYPNVNATSWFGVVVPARTPRAIVGRLHGELARIVQMPDVRSRFEAQHAEVIGSTPEQFGKFLGGEIAQWTKIARAGNIRAD